METNFEVIINKGKRKDSPPKVTTEDITPVNEQKVHNEFITITIEREVAEYLRNAEIRDSIYAKDRINSTKKNAKVNNSILYTPEAKFQNALLRIIHQHNLPSRNNTVSHWIKVALAKHKKENSIEIQEQIKSIMEGVESCNEAVIFLEKELKSKYPDKKTWVATNDYCDAQYKIDLLAVAEDGNGSVEILYLVQVKNGTDKKEIQNITETHQGYLNSLPKLIGVLNKEEAVKTVEKEFSEVLDNNSLNETREQLEIFEMALDEYIGTINNPKDVRAVDFYSKFKEWGGKLNPFIVLGILRKKGVTKEHPINKYFRENEKIAGRLAETAINIPFSEEESMVFYKKSHIHTIIESTGIISVVMVGGKKVSEEKLIHPYGNREV